MPVRPPIADSGGRPAVHDRALRCGDPDGAEVSGVRRQGRVRHRLDRVVDGGQRGRERHVAGARDLPVGAGEVEVDPVAADRDLDLEADDPVGHPVVVEDFLVPVGSVRQRRNLGPRPGLRVVEERPRTPVDGVRPEAGEALLDATDPGGVGRNLRPEVPFALARGAGVETHELDDVAAELPLVEQLDGRDPQPLLEDARAIGALAARHLAADVGVVGDVGDERHQPAIEEDRARKCQIGQVRSAAHVRIVREEAVTGAETVRRIAPGDVLHETEEGAQMEGGDRGQGEEVARGVEDRDRAVAPFLDVRRVRGLDQGGHHLVGRGREAVRDDLGGDWIATRFHRRFPAERRILHPCRRCPIRPAGRQGAAARPWP